MDDEPTLAEALKAFREYLAELGCDPQQQADALGEHLALELEATQGEGQ
jgi:TorA maturation chaperone TorD